MSDEMIDALGLVGVSRLAWTHQADEHSRWCQLAHQRTLQLAWTNHAYEDALAHIRAHWQPHTPWPAGAPDPRTDDQGWAWLRDTPYRTLLHRHPEEGKTAEGTLEVRLNRDLASLRLSLDVAAREDKALLVDPVFHVAITVDQLSMRPFLRAVDLTQALRAVMAARLTHAFDRLAVSRVFIDHLKATWTPTADSAFTAETCDAWIRVRRAELTAPTSEARVRRETDWAQAYQRIRHTHVEAQAQGQQAHDAAPLPTNVGRRPAILDYRYRPQILPTFLGCSLAPTFEWAYRPDIAAEVVAEERRWAAEQAERVAAQTAAQLPPNETAAPAEPPAPVGERPSLMRRLFRR